VRREGRGPRDRVERVDRATREGGVGGWGEMVRKLGLGCQGPADRSPQKRHPYKAKKKKKNSQDIVFFI
jgi:hypothetical protein